MNAHGEAAAPAWASLGSRGPRRFWRRLLWALVFPRNRQRIQPTLSGTMLIALSLGIGTAAYNSANNILFITLSLLLACLVLSGVLAWLNLRGVAWRLRLEPPWRAGEDAVVGLELHNAKRVLPTYGLWFELKAVARPAEAESSAPSPAAGRWWRKNTERPLREILSAANRAEARGRLHLGERLDPDGAARLDWAFQPARRGRLRLEVESVGSLFPFGFLRKSHATDVRHEIIVWPAPVEYRRVDAAAARTPSAGERTARAGNGADLLALRRYEPGDSHRLIHWKASARLRQLLVRQFAAESQEGYALRFSTAAERWPRAEQFELAVSFAATLAEDLFRAGNLQRAALDDELAQPVRRVANLEAFLDRLAIAERRPVRPGHESISPPATEVEGLARRRVITFAPDGPRGVAAYVDGQKTATA
jgi:uncharacterized protein (DUF58 family)